MYKFTNSTHTVLVYTFLTYRPTCSYWTATQTPHPHPCLNFSLFQPPYNTCAIFLLKPSMLGWAYNHFPLIWSTYHRVPLFTLAHAFPRFVKTECAFFSFTFLDIFLDTIVWSPNFRSFSSYTVSRLFIFSVNSTARSFRKLAHIFTTNVSISQYSVLASFLWFRFSLLHWHYVYLSQKHHN